MKRQYRCQRRHPVAETLSCLDKFRILRVVMDKSGLEGTGQYELSYRQKYSSLLLLGVVCYYYFNYLLGGSLKRKFENLQDKFELKL